MDTWDRVQSRRLESFQMHLLTKYKPHRDPFLQKSLDNFEIQEPTIESAWICDIRLSNSLENMS